MRAKLRTWMGSWRVWVTIGCLAYLWGIRGRAPAIAAVWPWGGTIAVGLAGLAGLFLLWIVIELLVYYVLMPYVVGPFLARSLGDKKFPSRTPKAKEKAADSLMSASTAVGSAVWISLLVFPLTAFIQVMASGTDPISALVSWWRPDRWSWWHTGLFGTLFFLPLSISRWWQRRALDIYDEISPPPPSVAPTAQGTHEQTTISDPRPPPYVRANGGSRRRRRHRGT